MPEKTEIMRIMDELKNVCGYTDVWTEDDSVFYAVGDLDDCTGYVVEINTARRASRRKGNGQGCFWTDWEQWTDEEWEIEWYL